MKLFYALAFFALTSLPQSAHALDCINFPRAPRGSYTILENRCNADLIVTFYGGNIGCERGAGGRTYPCTVKISAGGRNNINVRIGHRIHYVTCLLESWSNGSCTLPH